jgi:proteasome lid subunit RPN8/RPN11
MAIGKVIWTPPALEDWERFCDAARQSYPNEYIESVIGFYKGKLNHRQEAHIVALWPLKHRGSPNTVSFRGQAVGAHKRRAAEKKLMWLGLLHTHPGEMSSYLSEQDHKLAASCDAIMMGSCRVTGTTLLTVHIPYWLPPYVVEQHGL